jgi:hypothetical protein
MLKSAICLLGLLFFTSLARASLLMYEPFDYPSGSTLVGQTNPNGQQWVITGALGTQGGTGPTVTSGGLSNAGLPASTGNGLNVKNITGDSVTPRIALPGQPYGTDSGTVYYSMVVQAPAVNVGNNTAGSFIAGFNNTTGSQAAALSAVGAALCIHANGTGYSYGIVNTNTATRAFNDSKIFGTADTVLIVASYTFGPGTADDVAKLYINPPSGTLTNGISDSELTITPDATSTADVGTGAADFIRTFFVRDNTSEPTGGMNIDEVRVWAVPEPASIGLLGVVTSAFYFRRRRC